LKSEGDDGNEPSKKKMKSWMNKDGDGVNDEKNVPKKKTKKTNKTQEKKQRLLWSYE
jgi:hypothetical protein